MPVKKRNTTHSSSIKKTVIVTKSKVPVKFASDPKLEKVNKMLSKTKWLSPEK
jgi:hypothetical protein